MVSSTVDCTSLADQFGDIVELLVPVVFYKRAFVAVRAIALTA